ncbi:hypothetical protein ACK8HH_17135 [Gordonia sp. LUNF6]|uniref:hypothetical protein n=1 Tax=Gordonia sp. LUNF6 TaxID=3388658 RepID=UPI003999C1EA
MAVAPPLLIPTPQLAPPRGGLLSVADIVAPGDLHWQNGVEYATNPTPGGVADEVSCDPIDPADLPEGVPVVTDDPLRVHTGFTCKHPGLTRDEIQAYARNKLTAGEGPAVERSVWPTIIADATTIAGTGAVSLLAGLGDLEAWLYESYGGTGVIHVPRGALPFLVKAKQIVVGSGGSLTTVLGTKVSAGAYPGTGPAAAEPAAGAAWIAATAAVQVRRSETKVRTDNGAAYFDHRDNSVIGLAERLYVVSWEHLAAAVQITLEEAP